MRLKNGIFVDTLHLTGIMNCCKIDRLRIVRKMIGKNTMALCRNRTMGSSTVGYVITTSNVLNALSIVSRGRKLLTSIRISHKTMSRAHVTELII